MTVDTVFRSPRLSGRPPDATANGLYDRVFGARGADRLQSDLQDWRRHNVAPWTLSHAGHDVGVGGFRIGFGDAGLELSFHLLPDAWGQGLASELVRAALDYAETVLREDRFFALVDPTNTASIRILEKAGFNEDGEIDGQIMMRLHLARPVAATPKR